MDDTVDIKYVGGHSEVVNSESGVWKRNEVKAVQRELAERLVKSGLFELQE